jgi:hypothetical protein
MLKKISTIEGIKNLNKTQQLQIKGGLRHCQSDLDCYINTCCGSYGVCVSISYSGHFGCTLGN